MWNFNHLPPPPPLSIYVKFQKYIMVPHAYIFTRHVQSYLYVFRPSTDQLIYFLKKYRPIPMACHGHDHILVGFITTNAISAYHH